MQQKGRFVIITVLYFKRHKRIKLCGNSAEIQTGRVVRKKNIYRAHDASHVKRKTSMRDSRGGAAAARSCCWPRRQLVLTLLAVLLFQLGKSTS
uniref:Uncharacterized protein n=1 Tax=Trichogramma kaykai TaxID=54128 RepID=A0ABD2W112_9HYME